MQVSSTSVLDATVDSSMEGNGTVMDSSSSSGFPHLVIEASVGSVVASSSVNVQKSRAWQNVEIPRSSVHRLADTSVKSSVSVIPSQGSQLSSSDSLAELRFIANSSWAN
ncbi:hypothetical protein Q3G72_003388 [Acer saccharum]|nr:hypothetical protein Q3G72_003388 [Acer saccharum]